jgi:penicillin-binding protein 2
MPDGTSRDWYLGDDFISGIGQGDILTTPLQLNNITTFFANGGHLYQPKIVWKINGVGETKPKVINENFVDQEDYDVIRKGLNAAVEPGGTAYPLFDFPLRHGGIKLAGKTGTSEYISPQGEEKTHAWFTVFGPYYKDARRQGNLTAADKPIALTVFLEGGGAGSDDAAPVAKDMLDFWFGE